MQILHQGFCTFANVFLGWINNKLTKLDNYNQEELAVVLFIENLDFNVYK